MDIHKIVIISLFFVNALQGMDISPRWEKIRIQALTYAQGKDHEIQKVSPTSNNQKKISHTRKFNKIAYLDNVTKAKNIRDVLLLIRRQAQVGGTLAKSDEEKLLLNEVIKKAKPGISTGDMHYCLITLEQFFTGKTTFYDIFKDQKTIVSMQALLMNNMSILKNNS